MFKAKELKSFDAYAEKYDAWFKENKNLFSSEVAVVAWFLKHGERILSIGCGSGLFEDALRKDYNIDIREGIEPSEAMSDIARKRGMEVTIGTAEEADFGKDTYDTLLFNGTPGYIDDLQKAFRKAAKALKSGGKIVVIDVPKESSFAILYNLGKIIGTWDDDVFKGVKPDAVYPIEFVKEARWRTTAEKVELLKRTGFGDFDYAQTLTRHPLYANEFIENPTKGYQKGDYVAIKGIKKENRKKL